MSKTTLPDSQIEQLIIKKFYTDGQYSSLVTDFFSKKYFENKHHALILTILIKYFRTYHKQPDNATVNLMFQKFEEQSKDKISAKILIDTFNLCINNIIANEDFIRDNIFYFFKNKMLYYSIIESLDDIEKKQDISKIQSTLAKLDSVHIDRNIGHDYFKDLDKHYDYLTNPVAKISTGYRQLDNITNGGWNATGRNLITFIAQSGLGKSLMMSNLAKNDLMLNKFPLIISCELSEQVYSQRITAHISEFDVNALGRNIVKLKPKINDFKNAYNECDLIIKEYPPNTVNCSIIQHYVEKLVQIKRKPDIIYIDYINLLRPNMKSSRMTMYEKCGEVSRDMRALSYIFEIPIVSATQINRDGYDSNDIGMDNTSESMGIVHTSDFIASMWQQEGDKEANRMNMTILKNRLGGQEGKVLEFFINYVNLTIKDPINMSKPAQEDNKLNKDLNDLETI